MAEEQHIPEWEKKLQEQFTWENNHAVWKHRDSAEAVVAFVKEELNAPIEQYKKDLYNMVIVQLRAVVAMGNDETYREQLMNLIKQLEEDK